MSSTQDVRFSEEKIAQGRQLANKLFNASRLVLLRAARAWRSTMRAPVPETVEDAWILSRLQRAKADTARAIEAFEFHRAALGLYDFVYGELCDWYLEIVKPRLYEDDNAAVSRFALDVLAETLAIAHPVIPFVTEELWSHVPGAEGLLMARRWPRERPRADRRRRPRRRSSARSARCRSCAAGATAIGAAPGAVLPARLDADGYDAHRRARRAARALRVGRRRRAGRDRRRAGRQRRGAAVGRRRPRAEARARSRSAGPGSTTRSRAPSASSPTRASWPRRPSRSSPAERDKLARLQEERASL